MFLLMQLSMTVAMTMVAVAMMMPMNSQVQSVVDSPTSEPFYCINKNMHHIINTSVHSSIPLSALRYT